MRAHRLFHASEGQLTVNLNATVCGDFMISVYHARNALKGMGRPQGIKVCQFQMHTGFITEEETLIHLDKSELDDLPDDEHIPMNFSVSVPISVSSTERPPASSPPWMAGKLTKNASVLFSTQLEYEENVENFSKTTGFVRVTPSYLFAVFQFQNQFQNRRVHHPDHRIHRRDQQHRLHRCHQD